MHVEQAASIGGVKAVPAVRALAKKLKVDLSRVRPSGADGVVTMKDVKDAAASGSAALGAAPARGVPASAGRHLAPELPQPEPQRGPVSLAGKPVRTAPPSQTASGQPEQLKGVRRNMARVMADAHAQVVPTTLVDDADLHAWIGKQDITARLIRAIVFACKTVPALNAWFDGKNLTRTLHPHVDIGIAVDTDDGLFVPALRNADVLDAAGVRAAIKRLRTQVEDRTHPGLGAVRLHHQPVQLRHVRRPLRHAGGGAADRRHRRRRQAQPRRGGGDRRHRSRTAACRSVLTFDHRAATGGEAARFLKAMLDDLALPN